MPPKRKQPAAKETKVEESLAEIENNGDQAMMEDKPIDDVEEKPRRGKATKKKVEDDVLDEPKEKKSRGRGTSKKPVDEEMEEEPEDKPKRGRGNTKKAAKEDADEDLEEGEKPKRGRKKAEENGGKSAESEDKPKRGGKAAKVAKHNSTEDEEKPKKGGRTTPKPSEDSEKAKNDDDGSVSPAPEDESDDAKPAKKGKNGKAPSKSGSVDSKNSHEEEGSNVEDEKDEEEVKPKKGRGAKKAAQTEQVTHEDERPKRSKAAKKYYDDNIDEDGEPIIKKSSRSKKEVAASKESKQQAKEEEKRLKEEARLAREEERKEKEAAREEAKLAKEEAKQAAALKEAKDPANQTATDYENIDFGCTKKNALDQEHNFKIASWNVDGLRSWLKKDGLTYIEKESPDILCFQETRCSEDKLPDEVKEVEGYEKYWLGGQKEGYAGVSVFSKTKALEVQYGIGDERLDEEGRCLTLEYEKFYLVCAYVPNSGRKLVTLDKRLEWNEAFKTFVKKMDEKKPVVICGDMNVAHNEIDIANPKNNKKNAGFTQEERDGMTDFIGAGFVDTFRKLYPDQTDIYTFWTYLMKSRSKNIGWRLDYFLVSDRLMETVCDSVIRDQIFGSDHCPITLFLTV